MIEGNTNPSSYATTISTKHLQATYSKTSSHHSFLRSVAKSLLPLTRRPTKTVQPISDTFASSMLSGLAGPCQVLTRLSSRISMARLLRVLVRLVPALFRGMLVLARFDFLLLHVFFFREGRMLGRYSVWRKRSCECSKAAVSSG